MTIRKPNFVYECNAQFIAGYGALALVFGAEREERGRMTSDLWMKARRDLAERLGVHEEELTDRGGAARGLSLSAESLRRRADDGPPFYRVGKWTWYLRVEVDQHRDYRDGKRASEGLRFGQQPVPQEIARPRVAAMHASIDRWRLRQEWTRSHQLLTIGAKKSSPWRVHAAERLSEERAMLSRYREGDITPNFRKLAEHVIGRSIPDGESWADGLFLLVAAALETLIESETRWLDGDPRGMPRKPPFTAYAPLPWPDVESDPG